MKLAGKAIWLTAGAATLAALTTDGATADSTSPGPAVTPLSFEATIAESREALRKILNGDPSGYVALFADREDITLGNPFGPFGKGRAAVKANLGNAATKYRDGSIVAIDRIATYGDGKILVLVEVEHLRAKLGSSPDFAEASARVTTVFERTGKRWRLVHRHADPITSARPAESMLGK
jgi:ketosteroid isomerase-like protein